MNPRHLTLLVCILTVLMAACRTSEKTSGPTALPLEGTEWTLIELDGRPASGAAGDRSPTLHLDATNHRAAGFAGVNRFSGSYQVRGTSLQFGPLAATRMAGPPQAMAGEADYLATLARVSAFRVSGARLELMEGTRVAASFIHSATPPSR